MRKGIVKRRDDSVMEKLTEDEAAKWADIVDRAYCALDDGGVERYEKRKAEIEAKKARMGAEGRRLPIYRAWCVQRALMLFAETFAYAESVKRSGAFRDEMLTAMEFDAEAKLVADYVRHLQKAEREFVNGDLVDKARGALGEIIEEGDEGKRSKAVTFALERLDRQHFAAEWGKKGDMAQDGSSNRTVYRVSKMNINVIGGTKAEAAKIDLSDVCLPIDVASPLEEAGLSGADAVPTVIGIPIDAPSDGDE